MKRMTLCTIHWWQFFFFKLTYTSRLLILPIVYEIRMYCLYFIDEEPEALKFCNLLEVIQLERDPEIILNQANLCP